MRVLYNSYNFFIGVFCVKRLLSAVTVLVILCLSFAGCGKQGSISFSSGEIVKGKDNSTVNFVLVNETGKTIESLSVVVRTFSDNNKKEDEKEVVYPIEVENGMKATISMKTKKECVSAKAVSYKYKTSNGAEKSGSFGDEFTAYVKKASSSSIKTREQLAEKIIRDVNNQFLKGGSLSTGSYDEQKKRLVIVSKYKDKYNTCLSAYEENPDAWQGLVDGIVSMSKTCHEEFVNNKFDDVSVSVGIISKDEELMFSATDGELIDSLGR